MDYLIVIDYQHLDEPVFLKSLAQSLSELRQKNGIIVHGDSSYTDRIIQTGVLSDEARKRSIKDLNNRLVALFADNGISAVGLNGYQREIIRKSENGWQINHGYLSSFPDGVQVVLSTLVSGTSENQPEPAPLHEMVDELATQINFEQIIVFSKQDAAELFDSDSSPLPFTNHDNGVSSEILDAHLSPETAKIRSGVVITSTRKLKDSFTTR